MIKGSFFFVFILLVSNIQAKSLDTSVELSKKIYQAWVDLDNKKFDKTLNALFELQEKVHFFSKEQKEALYSVKFRVYIELGIYEKAREESYRFYQDFRQYDEAIAKIILHHSLFTIHFKKEEYESAIVELKEALPLLRKIKDYISLSGRMNDIGICYQRRNMLALADRFFNAANVELDQHFVPSKEGHWDIKFAIRDNIASCEETRGNYGRAIGLLSQTVFQTDSIDRSGDFSFTNRRIKSLIRMAEIEMKRENPKQVLIFLNNSKELIGRVEGELGSLEDETRFNLNEGYRNYFNYLGDYHVGKKYDSLLNNSRNKRSKELKDGLISVTRCLINENTEKLIQKRQIQESETRLDAEVKTKWSILIIALLSIITLILVFMVRIKRRKARIYKKNAELIAAQYEIEQLRVQKLSDSLESKHQNLQHLALGVKRQSSLLKKLFVLSKRMGNDDGQRVVLARITEELKKELSLDQGKMEIEKQMELMSNDFSHKISNKFPELSPLNKELCAQLAMNLSNKEIALLRGVSPDSVTTAKMRLRKKMNFTSNAEMIDFLRNVSNQ